MTESRQILDRVAPPGVTVAWGDDPDQAVEVFAAVGEPRATVFALHGGFWRPEFDRSHLRPFCHALAAAGFAVVAVEYRRSGVDDASSDVARGLALPLAELGLPADAILTGHSAGGQLALWAAARPWRRNGALRGVVALAPVSDLVRCYDEALDGDAAAAFLGGDPARFPDRYAQADPLRAHVDVPVRVLHGDDDRRVPVAMSRDYAAVTGARLRELPDTGHFELIDPLSHAWPHVLTAFDATLADR